MSKIKVSPSVSATTRAELRRVAGLLSQVRHHGVNKVGKSVSLRIDAPTDQANTVVIELSAETLDQITHLLEEAGTEALKPLRRQSEELTTQEAADQLGVSRPYLVKLLDAEKIPYRRVGQHRRIRKADLARFELAERERRVHVMQELVAETEALGLSS